MNPLFTINQALDSVVAEPVSLVSDIALSFASFYFYFRLKTVRKEASLSNYSWESFFLFFSASTFFGGMAHGIFNREANPTYDALWISMQVFAGCATYSALKASLLSEFKETKFAGILIWIAKAEFLLFLPLVFYYFDFRVVAIYSGIGLIQLICIYCFSPLFFTHSKRLLLFGIICSILPVIITIGKVQFNNQINHIHLAHAIMFMCLCLMYYGVIYSMKEIKNKSYERSIYNRS